VKAKANAAAKAKANAAAKAKADAVAKAKADAAVKAKAEAEANARAEAAANGAPDEQPDDQIEDQSEEQGDEQADGKTTLLPDRQIVMTLFSGSLCPLCHRVRITLAEKEIDFNTVPVDGARPPGDLSEINPYNSVPTLVDRDIVIYDSRTILDYLEERFPHPPLMPIDPMRRARLRLGMYHIETDWYPQLKKAQSSNRKVANKARKVLEEALLSQVSIFQSSRYFLNDEFSLLDCSLASILWRLPPLNITYASNRRLKPVWQYAKRIFERPSFRLSLTEAEADLAPR